LYSGFRSDKHIQFYSGFDALTPHFAFIPRLLRQFPVSFLFLTLPGSRPSSGRGHIRLDRLAYGRRVSR
jgi:hypothetical protein